LSALVLDHIAHWVPDPAAANAALVELGFCVTPFSAQRVGDPPVSAGTGNHCVMLEQGYLEFLAPTGETPNAATLRAGIQRYTGVHLIAFGTNDPADDHRRLAANGFAPLEPVRLSRTLDTQAGEATARFTVVRTPAGAMPEGRVQFVEHHTPELLWQSRYLAHANGALALARVEVCVADPTEAAARYALYTGLPVQRITGAPGVAGTRGAIVFRDASEMAGFIGLEPPCMPWIAGYVVTCRAGTKARRAVLPPSLGGVVLFEPTI
jgi:hypothetical protein